MAVLQLHDRTIIKAQVAVHLNFTIAQEKKSVNPDKIHTDDKNIFCNQNLVMQVIFQKIICRYFFEVSSIGLKAEHQKLMKYIIT